jgi:hypothetical protein
MRSLMNKVTRTKSTSHLCPQTGSVLAGLRSNPINLVIVLRTKRKNRALCNWQIQKELEELKNSDCHICRLKFAKNRHQSMLFIDLGKLQVLVNKAAQAAEEKREQAN